MRELHAYENEDGTFRVEIHDKAEYLSTKGAKEIKDIIVEIPRAEIEITALGSKIDEFYPIIMSSKYKRNKKNIGKYKN